MQIVGFPMRRLIYKTCSFSVCLDNFEFIIDYYRPNLEVDLLFVILISAYLFSISVTDKQPIWPGIAVFLQNALIFFR